MGQKDKGNVAGDVFIREDLTRPYDAESMEIDNSAGVTALIIPAGYPFEADGTAIIGNNSENSAAFLLLNEARVPAGDKEQVAVLARGTGVVVNSDALPTVDLETPAVALIQANLQTTMEALGFVYRSEPAEIEVQVK